MQGREVASQLYPEANGDEDEEDEEQEEEEHDSDETVDENVALDAEELWILSHLELVNWRFHRSYEFL